MNADFVNIKVDREERPDLDQIYQTAHALLTRRARRLAADDVPHARRRAVLRRHLFPEGGALRPARLPRSAAARRGGVSRAGRRRSREQAAQLEDALASLEPGAGRRRRAAGVAPAAALAELERRFDPEHGGFGAAPKFPHATDSSFCLRAARARPATPSALDDGRASRSRGWPRAASTTSWAAASAATASMREWTIPHFEKMLYDNGPLLALYADLARVDRRRRASPTSRAASSAG